MSKLKERIINDIIYLFVMFGVVVVLAAIYWCIIPVVVACAFIGIGIIIFEAIINFIDKRYPLCRPAIMNFLLEKLKKETKQERK